MQCSEGDRRKRAEMPQGDEVRKVTRPVLRMSPKAGTAPTTVDGMTAAHAPLQLLIDRKQAIFGPRASRAVITAKMKSALPRERRQPPLCIKSRSCVAAWSRVVGSFEIGQTEGAGQLGKWSRASTTKPSSIQASGNTLRREEHPPCQCEQHRRDVDDPSRATLRSSRITTRSSPYAGDYESIVCAEDTRSEGHKCGQHQ